MDSKTFTATLARNLGTDQHRVASQIDAFAEVLRRAAQSMERVAVPSFGSFDVVKVDEEIITDRTSGHRVLLPPQINVEFNPASLLRKKLSGHE